MEKTVAKAIIACLHDHRDSTATFSDTADSNAILIEIDIRGSANFNEPSSELDTQ